MQQISGASLRSRGGPSHWSHHRRRRGTCNTGQSCYHAFIVRRLRSGLGVGLSCCPRIYARACNTCCMHGSVFLRRRAGPGGSQRRYARYPMDDEKPHGRRETPWTAHAHDGMSLSNKRLSLRKDPPFRLIFRQPHCSRVGGKPACAMPPPGFLPTRRLKNTSARYSAMHYQQTA
jgi:hypothetical protein